MADENEAQNLVASLRQYLEELQETGVDSIPWGEPPIGPGVVVQESPPEPVGALVSPVEAGESLDGIRADLGECQRCSLGNGRTSLVFGVGNPKARLVFVGEAPGRDEDIQGEPFVGEAGQLLTKIIQAMGFNRSDVYICNVLKCRLPENSDPEPTEVEACATFMLRQLQAINPQVIVALGRVAAQTLLSTDKAIPRLRGRFSDYHGIPLMPTYHPAELLQDQSLKKPVWDDMQQVMKLLGLKKQ